MTPRTDAPLSPSMLAEDYSLPRATELASSSAQSNESKDAGDAPSPYSVRPNDNRRRPSRRSPSSCCSSLRSSGSSLRSSLKSTSSSSHDVHSKASNDKIKRNVSFSSLEIRSYFVTLGDAPTYNGPPVSLDWEYDPAMTEEHEINNYELFRDLRREKHEMVMPPELRQHLLMHDAGFSREQITGATKEARRAAKQRERTTKAVKYGFQPVEEALEKTKRKFSLARKSSHL